MNMDNYQREAARTISPALSESETQAHALYEIASETGEIHGIFQKAYQGHEIDEDDLKSEIGDLLWGVAELCTVRGYAMGEIAQRNIEKINRRYPNGFDPERSLHRGIGTDGASEKETASAGKPAEHPEAGWLEDDTTKIIGGMPHLVKRSRCSACRHLVYAEPQDAGRYCSQCGARMTINSPETEEIDHAPLD